MFPFNFLTKGILTHIENTHLNDIIISVGILVIAIDNPNTEGKGTVNGFDELCDNDVTGIFIN